MRIRQLALVAADLEPVLQDLCAVLNVGVAFRDPGITTFGLSNALLALGDSFLEVVSPAREIVKPPAVTGTPSAASPAGAIDTSGSSSAMVTAADDGATIL